ncbi:DUF3566 domain-containing protein [Streptomyces mirabilis]|uniref:DUF3566 domain-containing protein n=1 Tax=Streptomyces mirabilis TaxID=68239 RepID=UPI0033FF9EA7
MVAGDGPLDEGILPASKAAVRKRREPGTNAPREHRPKPRTPIQVRHTTSNRGTLRPLTAKHLIAHLPGRTSGKGPLPNSHSRQQGTVERWRCTPDGFGEPAYVTGRRALLRPARTDPWSVMTVSFLVSLAVGLRVIVTVAVLWMPLSVIGQEPWLGWVLAVTTVVTALEVYWPRRQRRVHAL